MGRRRTGEELYFKLEAISTRRVIECSARGSRNVYTVGSSGSETGRHYAPCSCIPRHLSQHLLNCLPLPQGHGSLRPTIAPPAGRLANRETPVETELMFRREQTGQTPATLPDGISATLSRRVLAYVRHHTMSMINNSFYRSPAERASRSD